MNVIKMRMLLWAVAASVVTLGTSKTSLGGDENQAVNDPVTEIVDSGYVILEGQFIGRPYRIVETADGVEINGHAVAQEDVLERGRRRSGTLTSFHDRVSLRLLEGGLVFGWRGTGYTMMREDRAIDFLSNLVSNDDTEMKIEMMREETELPVARREWEALVDDCQLPESVVAELAPAYYESDSYSGAPVTLASYHGVMASIGSPELRKRYSLYILTVGGMALSVFALGTLLTYRPAEKLRWRDLNLAEGSSQLVVRAALLLAALALMDLVCTSMSRSTAGFLELNPLGSAILATPWLLVAFKVGATALSVAILCSLRRYHGAQVASWWLALFCTVLTIRWVTFNSMFLS